MRRADGALLLLLALLPGCRDAAPSAGVGMAPPPARTAAEGAFCAEHGVLESLCTKCNPALVAVFRAKKDFCEEHGLPESICPACHPERGGRPARDVSALTPPPEGTLVRFRAADTALKAGIEVARAVDAADAEAIQAPAVLAFDPTRIAVVNARVAGVVTELRAAVGTHVKEGAPLAVLQSAAVSSERSRLQAARVHAEVERAAHERQRRLHAEGIAASVDVDTARAAWEAAEAEADSVAAELAMLQAPEGQGDSYVLTAPRRGVLLQIDATVGAFLEAGQQVLQLVDNSVMVAEVAVAERDLPRVAPGQDVALAVDGSEAVRRGTVDSVAPRVDPTTRTAVVRVMLPNPDGALRANVQARATITGRPIPGAVRIPRAAVQEARGARLAFVRLTPDSYETRHLLLADAGPGGGDDSVTVLRGVKAGEQVVTQGSFLMKTETLKDSIGAGCCDVD